MDLAPYQADKSLTAKLARKLALLLAPKWAYFPESCGPRISIGFDDAPLSAARFGLDYLSGQSIQATYYIAMGLTKVAPDHLGGYTPPELIKELYDQGHEIACHSYSHADCARLTANELALECQKNRTELAKIGISPPRHFAYPFGSINSAAKKQLSHDWFTSCRALHCGLIGRKADLGALPAIGIEGPSGPDRARHYLKEGLKQNAWVILFTHDVRDWPSTWGTRTEDLKAILSEAKESGYRFVTMEQAISEAQLS
jgi:peptidoglycan/xylan/chitin deacetylase (PgdA/CDA1 family)